MFTSVPELVVKDVPDTISQSKLPSPRKLEVTLTTALDKLTVPVHSMLSKLLALVIA